MKAQFAHIRHGMYVLYIRAYGLKNGTVRGVKRGSSTTSPGRCIWSVYDRAISFDCLLAPLRFSAVLCAL